MIFDPTEFQAIEEAIQNSRDNGNDPDAMTDEDLATDLWMSADCETIPYEIRLKIVRFLRNKG